MNEQDRHRAIVVLDLLGEGCTEQNIDAWLASAQPVRLPCGCIGTCDPYAHDVAWDWDGTPSRPSLALRNLSRMVTSMKRMPFRALRNS
jgi:hypothetical protein